MSDRRRTRRELLGTVGAATALGLAGCAGLGGLGGGDDGSDGDGDGGGGGDGDGGGGEPSVESGTIDAGERPPYADLVPAGDGPTAFTAYDLTTEGDHRLGDLPEDPTDPLRFDGAVGAVAARAMATYILGLEGLGFVVERYDLDGVTHYAGVDGVGAMLLPVDVDGMADDAESNGLDLLVDADDRVAFRGPQGRVLGATADAFLLAPSPSEAGGTDLADRLVSILDARAGAAESRHEVDDEFDALLRRADTGGSVACAYAPGGSVGAFLRSGSPGSGAVPFYFLSSGFDAASGAVGHLTTKNGEPPQPASLTATFPDQESVDTAALTGDVGTAASDRAFVRDGTTVRVSGRYSWEALSAYERDRGGVEVN